MREVVILSAVRTPIGKYGGALADVPVQDLGSLVIKEAIGRARVEADQVEMALMGCVLQAGLGQNPARQAALKAGLSNQVVSYTVNHVCGSGLNTVLQAAQAIMTGDVEIAVAGGMENMSRAAYLVPNARFGYRMGHGNLTDSMISDGLWCAVNDEHMGMTAEKIAKKWSISREEQDAFAVESQQRAVSAVDGQRFSDEIIAVGIENRGKTRIFDTDEYPRREATVEGLSKLKPAFKLNGTVTAGNASGINDGAAAVVLASAEKAKELGSKPIARFVAGTMAGVDPSIMGIGPVPATQKALAKAGWSADELDLIELNEAFAAQSIAVKRDLGLDAVKINVNGGAIALGHPIGASGTRILVTLLHEMKKRDAKKGLAALCIGGGQGIAALVEKF